MMTFSNDPKVWKRGSCVESGGVEVLTLVSDQSSLSFQRRMKENSERTFCEKKETNVQTACLIKFGTSFFRWN